jgi:hypothetical protein
MRCKKAQPLKTTANAVSAAHVTVMAVTAANVQANPARTTWARKLKVA